MKGPVLGVSLLETLVALAVLTTGLLGMQAFLGHSIGTLADTVWQQRALRVLADGGELLWLLPATALELPPDSESPPDCSTGSPCSANELLVLMLANWREHVTQQLPSGTVELQAVGPIEAQLIELRVEWQSRDGSRRELLRHYAARPGTPP